MKKFFTISIYVIAAFIVGAVVRVAIAGSLTPPSAPQKTMYTLADIYNLASGTMGTLGSGPLPPTPGSVSATFNNISSIYNTISTGYTTISSTLAPSNLAHGVTLLGVNGTLYGDIDPTKVLTTSSVYPGTFTPPVVGNISAGVTFGVSNSQTGTYTPGTPGTGVPKTNQAVCYDVSGSVITCTSTGQDAELTKGFARSYTDNGDGTITDNATGLVWQKCSDGLSGSTCSTGTAATINWTDALTYCSSNTAGLPGSSWYLPNYLQLVSLLDFGVSAAPFINVTYFPGTVTGGNGYWSSNQIPSSASSGSYSNGETIRMSVVSNTLTNNLDQISTADVRCVRGE
jgi:hypothetical protein